MKLDIWNAEDSEEDLLFTIETDIIPRIGDKVMVYVFDDAGGMGFLYLEVKDVEWHINGERYPLHKETPRRLIEVRVYCECGKDEEDRLLFAMLHEQNARAEIDST